MRPVTIVASGMVTGAGLDAAASCAAIRAGISAVSETRFRDRGGEWILASTVPLEKPWTGLPKHVHMTVPAIRECLVQAKQRPDAIPLLLCVAESERPGRLEGLETELLEQVQTALGIRLHSESTTFARGRIGGVVALQRARSLIYEQGLPFCLIAGVDSLVVTSTLATYEKNRRLLTSINSDGFIAGEAAAGVLVGKPAASSRSELVCWGIGSGTENATLDSGEPFRADGLVQAIRSAFADAERGYEKVHYRLSHANGEQYWFKEAALAMTRTLRVRKEEFDIWHPADCVGETGAATVPVLLAVALAAARKGYAPGPGVLCQVGSDRNERAALMLSVEGDRR